MKVVFLVPSADYVDFAGARIRYLRLADAAAEVQVEFTFVPIDAFDARHAVCDVAIVSKCYDARALVAAAVLARRGIRVGVDIFDDYFSDESDSRLTRYRNWLRQILSLSDFALCSTPALAGVIERYRGDLPVHVMRDAAPCFAAADLTQLLESKLAEARAGGVMRVCWFGMGDNPCFPVGLSDLAAFSGHLAQLNAGVPVELTVLTNRRALDASGLALLARLPVPTTIEEWSEAREAEVLGRSLVCFLPVNAQPFSTAKSSNRAVTALTRGCQILSVGFPLYADLSPWIYRDAATLLHDWTRGEFRLSAASLPALQAKIDEIASTTVEAKSLAAFLQGVAMAKRQAPADAAPIALLHGCASDQAAHVAVKQAGGISVGLPFCTQPLDFDAIVRHEAGRTSSLLVAETAIPSLRPERRKGAAVRRIGRRKFVEICGGKGEVEPESRPWPLPLQLALYDSLVEQARDLVSDAFGPTVTLLSEDSPLPLEPVL